jgi:hypothetical protein
VLYAGFKYIEHEAEAVYEETLVAPSGLVSGSKAILDLCGLGNSLWIAATLVAAGAVTGKEPVLPEQHGHGANYRSNVFWKFHQVDPASHTWTVVHERAYFFNPLPFKRIKSAKHNADIEIQGYRQSWRYFHEFKAQVCDRFTLQPADQAVVRRRFVPVDEHLHELNLTWQDTVSVHVRRGDYLRKPHVHPVLPVDYYIKAAAEVRKGLVGPGSGEQPLLFVVFSDDISWCKKELGAVFTRHKHDHVHFVSPHSTDSIAHWMPVPRWLVVWLTGDDSWVYLYAMVKCYHHVVANSSYSWWGAYLSSCDQASTADTASTASASTPQPAVGGAIAIIDTAGGGGLK